MSHLLNSPGNFTAAKLAWVKDNEPELFSRIDKVMLPGDYIAMRLTGEACTTVSGLSEGTLWDFKSHQTADKLLNYYGIPATLLPRIVPTFGEQGRLTELLPGRWDCRLVLPSATVPVISPTMRCRSMCSIPVR